MAARGSLATVAAAVWVLALGVAAAGATQLTVNTTTDDVTAGNGLCSLREAIAAVNTPGSVGDCAMADDLSNTIVLGPHEYDLTITPTGADDQSTGDLDVNATSPPLTIEGAGVGMTTINGAALQDRILHVLAGATVTIKDLTITGGHAPNGANGTNGSLIPTVTAPTAGEPGFPGGGIRNEGTLTLEGVAVTNNTAGSGGRGGFGASETSKPNVDGKAGGAGGAGGGIYNASPGSLTLTDVTVSGNTAGNGGMGGDGGIGATGPEGGKGGDGGCCGDGGGLEDVGGQVVITGSTFSGNRAGDGGSGGMGEQPAAGIGGEGGQGQGGSSGGAIAATGATATVSIANSTLSANFSGAGGDGGNGGVTNMSPIADFQSGGNAGNGSAGGGLFASGSATVTLTNTTVGDNQVGGPGTPGAAGTGTTHAQPGAPGNPAFGGGVYDSTTPAITLSDTLLASNELGNCAGNVTDGGHNLSFGVSDCPGTGFNRGDPKLGALADNGGPTETEALGAGSAAIDAGAGCQAIDQRGLPRPSGSACDIGAYEVTPPTVAVLPASAVSATGATLSGSVTANAGAATVEFQVGTTTNYDRTVAVASASGLSAQPESVALTGLVPGTTYHYRLVASSPDGTSASPDQTFTSTSSPPPPAEAPQLRKLKLKPAKFKTPPKHGKARGRTGTTISYSDSEAAQTTFVVLSERPGVKKHGRCAKRTKHARGSKCTLLSKVLTFTHADKAAANSLRFNRHLAAGRYRLQATPLAGGKTGRTVTVTFVVVG